MTVAASFVRCGRVDPAASPAALVGAWLIDALSGTTGISLTCSGSELLMLEVALPEMQDAVRVDVACVLGEPRFAGWQVLGE
jgi:hypothetical protein